MKELKEFGNLTPIGRLKTKTTGEIQSSRIGVGFETLDRDMWEPEQAWPVLSNLGAKWARVQSGWARTEQTKGVYDFDWLDEVVDKLIGKGVTPWLSISYGNRLYTAAELSATGVGYPPLDTEEERIAWQRYVSALVAHFKNRVDHYEVWNEPDLDLFWRRGPSAEDYVDLVRLTVEPLRRIQPEAKVIGGAIAWGMTPWSIKFLEDCMRAGLHKLIDIVSYHGYKKVPERQLEQEWSAFRYVLNKYKPSLEYWQGESGFQSYVPPKAVGVGALSTMKFSEAIQARMLLRRFLVELHHDTKMCSYFHMADFAHYAEFKETFHYGLIRLEDGSPKPAYYALQTLATLLCDPMEPSNGRTSTHISVLSDSPNPREIKVITWQTAFIRGDNPVFAWWIPESAEEDPLVQEISLTCWIEQGLILENPVLIEPVSQQVFAVNFEWDRRTCAEDWMPQDPNMEGVRVFRKLPICNSPLLLTDRSLLQLK